MHHSFAQVKMRYGDIEDKLYRGAFETTLFLMKHFQKNDWAQNGFR